MGKLDDEKLIKNKDDEEYYSSFRDENVVYVENEYLKIGANLSLGGALTYLAEHGVNNMINSHDWGRQVQMAYYGYPIPYEPEGFKQKEQFKGFMWDPIQSGDAYGNRSKVLDYYCRDGEIYVKCIPMQWPLDNCPGDCTFEVWYKLDGRKVKCRSRLNNFREEYKAIYPAHYQEQPAVYTNGVWHKLMGYLGEKPFTNDQLSLIDTDKNTVTWWMQMIATERWLAVVDNDNYGLGVYNPNTTLYRGGYAGDHRVPHEKGTKFACRGTGGPKDPQTAYIAPMTIDILDWNIVLDNTYYLIPGKLEEIRDAVYNLEKEKNHYFYKFDKHRHGFSYEGMVDKGFGNQDCLDFIFKANDKLVSPYSFYEAGKYSKILLDVDLFDKPLRGRVKFIKHDPDNTYFDSHPAPAEIFEYVYFKIFPNGRGIYEIDFSEIKEAIRKFEIEFLTEGHAKIYSIEIK